MNHETAVTERKVQLTGGSSYTVSLPKKWADNRDIQPGTRVALHTRGDQLVLTRDPDPADRERSVTIDATVHDPTTLTLSVASAYVAGAETITVEHLRDTTARRAVARTVRRFVGLEVMSEDEQRLSARTMLDVADLSTVQALTQIERTTVEMHAGALEALVEADAARGERLARQDDDVDRLFALVSRGFQQSLVDPAVTVEGQLTPFEYYMAARQLERVADHAEKMATIAGRLSGPPPEDVSADLLDYGQEARQLLQAALSGLLDGDGEEVLGGIVTDAGELLDELSTLDESFHERELEDGYLLGLVVDSLVRTTNYGVNVAETAVQARHRDRCR